MTQAIAPAYVPNRQGGYDQLTSATIESMPMSEFEVIAGKIYNRQSAFYYDTLYAKVAVSIPANAKQGLFLKGKGQTDTQFGTATTLGEKNEFHTNMISNGQFDDGTNFIMTGAGVQCIMSADLATTVGENGQITNADYTAATTKSAPNHLLQVAENLEVRFKRGEDIKKQAPIQFWSGVPGSGLEGASGSPNGGFFQLAQAGLVKFSYPVALESGNRFQFDVVNVGGAAFTPSIGFKVRIVIWGIAIKQQYPG